jgi:hypothetical protein
MQKEYPDQAMARSFLSMSPFIYHPAIRCYVISYWQLHKITHNEKFWEELIAYFPWCDTVHIEDDASNNCSIVACVFITAMTFLPSLCLATTEGFLPSRCLATIGGIHTHSNMILLAYSIFSLLSYFEKNRVGLWDYVAVCVFATALYRL